MEGESSLAAAPVTRREPARAGESWEVVVARYGRRQTLRSDVFLNHHLYGETDGPIGMEYFVWVLRNTHRTIIVDTGFSRQGGEARGRELLVDVGALFEQIGIDPATAPTVVVTHAHYDHVGNLPLFPDSPVVIARKELEFWMGPLRRKPLFCHSVEDAELSHLSRVVEEGRATLFEGRHELAPGVEIIEVGGHTPGQSMVWVNTLDGPVLLASDAVHYYEELERDMPFTSVVDVAGMYSAFTRIRSMVDEGAVEHLVPGHDPETLTRLVPGLDPDENVATIGRQG